MKKTCFLIILLSISVLIKAQDYQISFTGSGASTSVDSVYVTNLSQGTSLGLSGSEILHLVETVGIQSQSSAKNDVSIYPNPLKGSGRIEFDNAEQGDIEIEIFDISGKLICSKKDRVNPGHNVYNISGFQEGLYTVNISGSSWQKSSSFISASCSEISPTISSGSNLKSEQKIKLSEKSLRGLVQMQYDDGDTLLYSLLSGNYESVQTSVPTQSETINSEFVECTDLDGNNYAVVTIGNQTWMAENLKYLPSVVGASTGSDTSPYYYVYGYNGTDVNAAKSTSNYDKYGVLYNWPAALNGDAPSSANPSGVQGICPNGWHLPSDDEWDDLFDHLGGYLVAGGKLKETGTTHWNAPNTGATNEVGFTALPGGWRGKYGTFKHIGNNGKWWTSTDNIYDTAYSNYMVYTYVLIQGGSDEYKLGCSVRCVKD